MTSECFKVGDKVLLNKEYNYISCNCGCEHHGCPMRNEAVYTVTSINNIGSYILVKGPEISCGYSLKASWWNKNVFIKVGSVVDDWEDL